MRSFKGARIVFHPNWPVIDCTVRNLSGAGACVEMQGEYNTRSNSNSPFCRTTSGAPAAKSGGRVLSSASLLPECV
jgi:hypothetical protein